MKNFTLTLYAKRKSDGTYEYSLKVWENGAAGILAQATNFESHALVAQRLEAVLPVGGDASFTQPAEESGGILAALHHAHVGRAGSQPWLVQ